MTFLMVPKGCLNNFKTVHVFLFICQILSLKKCLSPTTFWEICRSFHIVSELEEVLKSNNVLGNLL
jgi:hypothetical protein